MSADNLNDLCRYVVCADIFDGLLSVSLLIELSDARSDRRNLGTAFAFQNGGTTSWIRKFVGFGRRKIPQQKAAQLVLHLDGV